MISFYLMNINSSSYFSGSLKTTDYCKIGQLSCFYSSIILSYFVGLIWLWLTNFDGSIWKFYYDRSISLMESFCWFWMLTDGAVSYENGSTVAILFSCPSSYWCFIIGSENGWLMHFIFFLLLTLGFIFEVNLLIYGLFLETGEAG